MPVLHGDCPTMDCIYAFEGIQRVPFFTRGGCGCDHQPPKECFPGMQHSLSSRSALLPRRGGQPRRRATPGGLTPQVGDDGGDGLLLLSQSRRVVADAGNTAASQVQSAVICRWLSVCTYLSAWRDGGQEQDQHPQPFPSAHALTPRHRGSRRRVIARRGERPETTRSGGGEGDDDYLDDDPNRRGPQGGGGGGLRLSRLAAERRRVLCQHYQM